MPKGSRGGKRVSESAFIKDLAEHFNEMTTGDLQGVIEARLERETGQSLLNMTPSERLKMFQKQDEIIRKIEDMAEKMSARYNLQQTLNKINANDDTRVILTNDYGGRVASIKMSQINSDKWSSDLSYPSRSVKYSKKDNTITVRIKYPESEEEIPF